MRMPQPNKDKVNVGSEPISHYEVTVFLIAGTLSVIPITYNLPDKPQFVLVCWCNHNVLLGERSPGMLSESHHSPQPPVIGHLRPDPPPCPAENLIMPRKLQNPCLDSKDHQNLHRELLFNQKIGKNVLNQKSELQRAMEKHKESQIKKELELQKQENRTPFEKVIEERARRLESQEKGSIDEEPSSKPEFLQVHAKLRARMDSK
ncbi:hypothetical protein J6590_048913 [Homalodisca vitripennis]|nr:hypothetical protein J6590_048913 [Homalodisca vitripennis]